MTEAKPQNESEKSTLRVLLPRILFTLATLGLWWWLADLDIDTLLESTSSLPLTALGLGLVVSLINLVVGSLRWRVLLSAYGAVRLPPFRTLVHLYYVGIFFNTFAPANVGGDVLRGHVTRRAFDGKAGAYLIVLIERVFGLAGLMLLASSLMTLAPIPTSTCPAGSDLWVSRRPSARRSRPPLAGSSRHGSRALSVVSPATFPPSSAQV